MADRLSAEIAMARAAGMSYGKWKVLHPELEYIEEEPVEPEVILVEKKSYARANRKPGKCQWCNKQIPAVDDKGRKVRYDRKYCSNTCRQTYLYYQKKDGTADA